MPKAWIVPAVITGTAAIVAGVLAQWYRVWLDNRLIRRRLLAQLADDLMFMLRTLRAMEGSRVTHGALQVHHLAKLDFLMRAYHAYEGQLTAIAGVVRSQVAQAFFEIAGVRETIREIEARNRRAEAGHGVPVPRAEVENTLDMLPVLVGKVVRGLAAVRLEQGRWLVTTEWWTSRTPWGRRADEGALARVKTAILEEVRAVPTMDPKVAATTTYAEDQP